MARRKADIVAYPLTVKSFQSHHQGCSPCVAWSKMTTSCSGHTSSGSVGSRVRRNNKESSHKKAQNLLSSTVCRGLQKDAPLQISSPFARHKAWSSAGWVKDAGEKSRTSGSFSRAEVRLSSASFAGLLSSFFCVFLYFLPAVSPKQYLRGHF